jgi:hypothetical protein
MTDTKDDNTIINFRTSKAIKESFFALCKKQHISATARLNDYMRKVLEENGLPTNQQPAKSNTQKVNDWRDELIRA